MQGNCSEPPPESSLPEVAPGDPVLLPLKDRQCLLMVSVPVWLSWSTDLWVDNLYIRLQRSQACYFIHLLCV